VIICSDASAVKPGRLRFILTPTPPVPDGAGVDCGKNSENKFLVIVGSVETEGVIGSVVVTESPCGNSNIPLLDRKAIYFFLNTLSYFDPDLLAPK
jgi:hypothetical protein